MIPWGNMNELALTFIGTGNAFSPGGLCCNGFLVNDRFLFDAPPHALSSLNHVGADANRLEAVIVSHHHGDHFLGLPFLLLHWKWKGRTRPVKVIGPRDTERLSREIAEMVFPGVLNSLGYDLEFVELPPGQPIDVEGMTLEAVQVEHDEGLIQSLGYVARLDGRTFAYTGDTRMCDAVLDLARAPEVLVSECASRADNIPVHMNLVDDMPVVRGAMRPESTLLLTHLTPDIDTNGLPKTMVAEDFKTFRF
jgi:ribonuclease BN (tRNA processing enzyme)